MVVRSAVDGRCQRRKHSAGRAGGVTASVAVAQLAQGALVVGPATAHLDPGFQEYLAVEQLLHGDARLAADIAQALALVADDDGLLAVALDPDHRVDAA